MPYSPLIYYPCMRKARPKAVLPEPLCVVNVYRWVDVSGWLKYSSTQTLDLIDRGKVARYADDHPLHYTYSFTSHPYYQTHFTMSDTQPELSDAEKMRLKRLARLGGPPTAAPSAPAPAADHPTEPHQPQPGPSASSRLLNSTPVQSTSTPKQAPKASTSTPPVTRPIKRPSPTSVRAEPAASPAIRKPAPPARLPVPYPEWEAQRIQGIFSVTLSVGLT